MDFLSGMAVLLVIGAALLIFFLTKRRNESEAPPSAADDSLRDPVTKLYNRAHLERRLKELMARCDRSRGDLAVLIWDIDGFIKFNNEFGQKEGDRFLSRVGEAITQSLRVYDEAFRFGPDEFCALLHPGDAEVAKEVIRRVGDVVSRRLFEGEAEFTQHSFSISGAAVFYPGSSETPDALLHEAAQALYQSKRKTVAV